MTATEQWIKDAIEGGWNPMPQYLMPWMKTLNVTGITWSGGEGDQRRYTISEILLLPEAWQAVGKTRSWREKTENTFEAEHTCWQAYWTGFYGHLADGLTIEDALTKIAQI